MNTHDGWGGLIDEDAYNNIIDLRYGPDYINTLPSSDNKNLFCIETNHSIDFGLDQLIEAYCIDENGTIVKVPIFKDENNYTTFLSNHTFGFLVRKTPLFASVSTLAETSIFGIEFQDSIIYRSINYQSDEIYGYCAPYPSGKVEVYEYSNGIYSKTEEIYDPADLIHHSLLNYKANIVEFNMKPYTIRVDLLPNGSYRYASWENKSISEKPDIVIDNGYRETMEGDEGIYTLVENYVFQNDEFYCFLSYKVIIAYYGLYYVYMKYIPLKFTVKQNDKVIITFTQDSKDK